MESSKSISKEGKIRRAGNGNGGGNRDSLASKIEWFFKPAEALF